MAGYPRACPELVEGFAALFWPLTWERYMFNSQRPEPAGRHLCKPTPRFRGASNRMLVFNCRDVSGATAMGQFIREILKLGPYPDVCRTENNSCWSGIIVSVDDAPPDYHDKADWNDQHWRQSEYKYSAGSSYRIVKVGTPQPLPFRCLQRESDWEACVWAGALDRRIEELAASNALQDGDLCDLKAQHIVSWVYPSIRRQIPLVFKVKISEMSCRREDAARVEIGRTRVGWSCEADGYGWSKIHSRHAPDPAGGPGNAYQNEESLGGVPRSRRVARVTPIAAKDL